MKYNTIHHAFILTVIFTVSAVNASETTSFAEAQFRNDEVLECKVNPLPVNDIIASHNRNVKVDKYLPVSMAYLNNVFTKTYNEMRNAVISHVTIEVAKSLFNFSVNGFAPENIAIYVSDGTKPFLPFRFANGVKITDVKPKGRTIVYRTEMPVPKDHNQAVLLAVAGRASATTTVCNDSDMVGDLLGRDIVIQYDYYDSEGEFFSSFTING